MFDTDRATNIQVARSENALGRSLKNAGAEVRVVRLDVAAKGKMGPDDLLATHGEEALARVIESAVPFDAVARVLAYETAGDALGTWGCSRSWRTHAPWPQWIPSMPSGTERSRI
ncbi:MAG: DUF3854 domain-containing protein [Sandaracinaceae bacterium]|nr:DUF3854 domain-containing protein [Sandaracinaceae bacterium]